MKGYIIISVGNDPQDDYVCASEYGKDIGLVFKNKTTAEKYMKRIQKAHDKHNDVYNFFLQEVEIIED
jgi:hypothetical protein